MAGGYRNSRGVYCLCFSVTGLAAGVHELSTKNGGFLQWLLPAKRFGKHMGNKKLR